MMEQVDAWDVLVYSFIAGYSYISYKAPAKNPACTVYRFIFGYSSNSYNTSESPERLQGRLAYGFIELYS